MLDNKTYNLLLQLVQEHKSLWRIKNHYIKECEGDKEVEEFWQHIKKEKEDNISNLLQLLRSRLS